MFDLLALPFMQRALVAGVVLALLLGVLSVFVVARRMAFFGDGVAHASLAGIALALLFGWAPLPVAILFALVIALLIYWLEHSTELSSDTIIGILFTTSMALGVVLLSIIPGFQPELISYLFGNLLTVETMDLWTMGLVATPALVWLFAWRRALLFTSIDEESAAVRGVATRTHTILLYVTLAVSVVLGVKLLGIILVAALLVTPAATSRLFTRSFRGFFWSTLVLSELTVVIGMLLSFFLNAPSGATIILVAAIVFFVVASGRALLVRR